MNEMDFTDVRYHVDDSVAVITIDRPDRMNAFRGRTATTPSERGRSTS